MTTVLQGLSHGSTPLTMTSQMSLHDASLDSRYCQAEMPGSTSINASVASYRGWGGPGIGGSVRGSLSSLPVT